MTNRLLRVFLCHSSNDKPAVRELYQKLRAEVWIQPWLDQEELFPGQDWNMEIEKAVESADAIIVCLSNNSITKEGYVQKEIKTALDYSDYKPEGTVFIIPVRLEECEPPRRLRKWQYEDYFDERRELAIKRLLVTLQKRAESLDLKIEEQLPTVEWIVDNKVTLSNGMELMRIPAGKFLMGSTKENMFAYDDERPQHAVNIPYGYWIARYPVTNELYGAYTTVKRIKHPVLDWLEILKHPVVYIKWAEALEYCEWLSDLLKSEISSGLILRLPTEAEWEKAARGIDGRDYPWGNDFDRNKCNVNEDSKGFTTPVDYYSPEGDSPYGCADMLGNIWEWTHSLKKEYPYKVSDGRENERASGTRILRGGSFVPAERFAHCAYRNSYGYKLDYFVGFRICLAPALSK